MTRELALPLLLSALLVAHAEEVVPGSLQDDQARKFLKPLNAVQVECPASLAETESDFLCATISRDARAFRSVVDDNTAHLKPVGPWASSAGGDDQQRSFLHKDGFMTVTFFPSDGTSSDGMMVIQYAMPHD